MVPWMKHDELLQRQKTYSRSKFYNEVLGLSYDSGTRPLTRQDIIDNCDSDLHLDTNYQDRLREALGNVPIYMGIDWGSGENTFTVLTMAAYIEGKFTYFYLRRFEGPEIEPQVQMRHIEMLIQQWKVRRIGCDYGGGFWPNDTLTRNFGWNRVAKYQYSTPSDKVRWDAGLKRFIVHRAEVMADVFNAIKRRDVFRFPNWDEFSFPFGSDCLNIFSEYNEQRRMNEYKKSSNCTDDTFHAMVVCFLVSMLDTPRPDIIAPDTHGGTS